MRRRRELEQHLVSALGLCGDQLYVELGLCGVRGGGRLDRRLLVDHRAEPPRAPAQTLGIPRKKKRRSRGAEERICPRASRE